MPCAENPSPDLPISYENLRYLNFPTNAGPLFVRLEITTVE